MEEDGVQQLYITDVKAGGLAFAKGLLPFVLALQQINSGGQNIITGAPRRCENTDFFTTEIFIFTRLISRCYRTQGLLLQEYKILFV